MLAWLGGKQKLVQKAKAKQRARAAAAGGSGGSAFLLPVPKAATAARPIKRQATDEPEAAPTFPLDAAMPAPGAQRGGRPPLAPAPANRGPHQPRLKRVKASLDLLALEMPAWQPMVTVSGGSGSEGAMGGGSCGVEGEQAGAGGADEAQHPPAAAMELQ